MPNPIEVLAPARAETFIVVLDSQSLTPSKESSLKPTLAKFTRPKSTDPTPSMVFWIEPLVGGMPTSTTSAIVPLLADIK